MDIYFHFYPLEEGTVEIVVNSFKISKRLHHHCDL